MKHGLAPDAYSLNVAIRQSILGSYRILYTVDEDAIIVHGVRHAARRPLEPGDLPTLTLTSLQNETAARSPETSGKQATAIVCNRPN